MATFDDTTVIVTGGARGQGAAEAALFVAQGATVLITDVLDDEGSALQQRLGDQAHFLHHDVGAPADWRRLIEYVETLPPLRVLVNNAAVHWARRISDEVADEVMSMWQTNLLGPLLGMQAVIAPMSTAGGGSIINVSSAAGMSGFPGLAAYGASKWGLRGLSAVAAAELAAHGIRVNSIQPGPIDTPMMAASPVAAADDGSHRHIPLRRIGTVDEVAELVAFLASPASAYITGAQIAIDGGMTAVRLPP